MGTMMEQPSSKGQIADLFAHGLRSNGVHRLLQTVRKHLGMDVAFVSQFRATDRVMEHVDADERCPLYPGQVVPLEQGYCRRVAYGELPELIPDTSLVPEAALIPETYSIPIGSHLSVPIRLGNGELYGTLCCFSYIPDHSLGERDMRMLRAFAEVLATHLEELSLASTARKIKLDTVRRALKSATSPRIVYQPIYRLRTGELAGLECLSRFDLEIPLSTSNWFVLADEVGLRQDLEVVAIRRALEGLDAFPESVFLSLNCSPQTVLSGALAAQVSDVDPRRLLIEITEHSNVADYGKLAAALKPLRDQGLRLAIDDAGAGYASMRHIISLAPDLIKLDMSLTSHIDTDFVRRALARALISFAEETNTEIIAEGIETPQELSLLRELGVDMGQGYLLREPLNLREASAPDTMHCDVRNDQIQLNMQQ